MEESILKLPNCGCINRTSNVMHYIVFLKTYLFNVIFAVFQEHCKFIGKKWLILIAKSSLITSTLKAVVLKLKKYAVIPCAMLTKTGHLGGTFNKN